MERIKLTKKACEIMIKFADSISKSPMAQKKAFKILSIILKNQELNSYEELQQLFGQVCISLTFLYHNNTQYSSPGMLTILTNRSKN